MRPHSQSPLYIALCLLLFVLILIGCGQSSDGSSPEPIATQTLSISTVETLDAGKAGVVTLGAIEVADGTIGQVMAVGSYGIVRFEGRFEDGVAKVLLPAEFTQQAGRVTLFGSTAGYAGQTELTIVAGAPVTPLTTLVGTRSLVADNRAWTTATVIPFDQFYNPVPDGTQLTLEAIRPDGSQESYTVETERALGWQKLYSSTTAGRTYLTSDVDGVAGLEASFDETPDRPTRFDISAENNRIPANGTRLVNLRTETLHDRNGNLLLDGTLVTFIVADSDGSSRSLPAYTIDGSAEITMQAASQVGEATVQAIVAQVVSKPLTLYFVEP